MALETKRKLIKFSNYSFCITLPKEAVDHMGWKKGDTLQVSFDDAADKIVVSKNNRNKNGKAQKTVVNNSREATINSDIQPIPKLRW